MFSQTSPALPPLLPGPPCPVTRTREPEATPAGIVTSIVFDREISPDPPHAVQIEFFAIPLPPHVGHVSGAWISIRRVVPWNASSKLTSIATSRFSPRRGDERVTRSVLRRS